MTFIRIISRNIFYIINNIFDEMKRFDKSYIKSVRYKTETNKDFFNLFK